MTPIAEIVLAKNLFRSRDDNDVIASVQMYAHGLQTRGVENSELPPRAMQASSVAYYCTQVLNGNIGQFVVNSRWRPEIISAVREGLQAIGARRQADLFENVVLFVEGTRKDLEAALASEENEAGAILQPGKVRFQILPQEAIGEYAGTEFGDMIASVQNPDDTPPGPRTLYRKRLDAIARGFFKAFTDHPHGYAAGCAQLRVANAAWIRSWKDVGLVDEGKLEAGLDRIAASIPDREARLKRRIEDQPWEFKRTAALVQSASQSLQDVTAIQWVEQPSGRFPVWNVVTSAGPHYVAFHGQRAELYRGGTSQFVTAIDAPEASAPRATGNWTQAFDRALPLPTRPLTVTPVSPPSPFSWKVILSILAVMIMMGVFVAGFGTGVVRDFQIGDQIKPAADARIVKASCRSKALVFRTCEIVGDAKLNGRVTRTTLEYFYVQMPGDDNAVTLMTSKADPSLLTTDIGQANLWNRILSLAAMAALGLLPMIMFPWVAKRNRKMRDAFAALSGKPVSAVETVAAKHSSKWMEAGTWTYSVSMPRKYKNLSVVLPSGRSPFFLDRARTKALAVASAQGDGPPMLVDEELSQLDLTQAERKALNDWKVAMS